MPKIVQSQVTEFIRLNQYSIDFMRIFRVFCGSDEEPCVRNQNLIFKLFFWAKEVKIIKFLTQSVMSVQQETEIPSSFKFRVIEDGGEIFFENGHTKLKY